MKKHRIGLLGAFVLCLAMTACGKEQQHIDYNGKYQELVKPVEVTEMSVKTGLGACTVISNSVSATKTKEGIGQADAYVAAVTVSQKGVILQCQLDCVKTKISFSNKGVITADSSLEYLTEEELGNCDNHELESRMIGKTEEDIRTLCADGEEELYLKAVIKAVRGAKYLGASVSEQLGLGIDTYISKSYDVSEEADGQAQPYNNIVAVTIDEQKVITSCTIDAIQSKINFNQDGVITSDLSHEVITKNSLGSDYGMIVASGIGKEWFEQAEAFAGYTRGKRLQEIKEIPLDDGGHTTDPDLAASVTMHVNDSIAALEKAVANAE